MSLPKSALLNNQEQPTDLSQAASQSVEETVLSTNGLAEKAETLRRAAGFECNPTEALEKLLKKHSGTQQIVLLQDFPDPDALSSAWAYRLIASAYNIQCDIYYSGTLSHQENIALVKLTHLPAKRWPPSTKEAPDLSHYQGYVLIDTQGTTSHLTERVKAAHLPLLLVIDHHAIQGKLEAEMLDIRPDIHATATILAQYLQSGLIKLDRSNSNHVKCATALMHGLRSDTNHLMQASEPDFLAAAFLSQYYDAQLLSAILQASRSRRV
ncbi:MAG: DHH family phosphoesterase, partial [Cyanobacteria bacterium J06623_5]